MEEGHLLSEVREDGVCHRRLDPDAIHPGVSWQAPFISLNYLKRCHRSEEIHWQLWSLLRGKGKKFPFPNTLITPQSMQLITAASFGERRCKIWLLTKLFMEKKPKHFWLPALRLGGCGDCSFDVRPTSDQYQRHYNTAPWIWAMLEFPWALLGGPVSVLLHQCCLNKLGTPWFFALALLRH